MSYPAPPARQTWRQVAWRFFAKPPRRQGFWRNLTRHRWRAMTGRANKR